MRAVRKLEKRESQRIQMKIKTIERERQEEQEGEQVHRMDDNTGDDGDKCPGVSARVLSGEATGKLLQENEAERRVLVDRADVAILTDESASSGKSSGNSSDDGGSNAGSGDGSGGSLLDVLAYLSSKESTLLCWSLKREAMLAHKACALSSGGIGDTEIVRTLTSIVAQIRPPSVKMSSDLVNNADDDDATLSEKEAVHLLSYIHKWETVTEREVSEWSEVYDAMMAVHQLDNSARTQARDQASASAGPGASDSPCCAPTNVVDSEARQETNTKISTDNSNLTPSPDALLLSDSNSSAGASRSACTDSSSDGKKSAQGNVKGASKSKSKGKGKGKAKDNRSKKPPLLPPPLPLSEIIVGETMCKLSNDDRDYLLGFLLNPKCSLFVSKNGQMPFGTNDLKTLLAAGGTALTTMQHLHRLELLQHKFSSFHALVMRVGECRKDRERELDALYVFINQNHFLRSLFCTDTDNHDKGGSKDSEASIDDNSSSVNKPTATMEQIEYLYDEAGAGVDTLSYLEEVCRSMIDNDNRTENEKKDKGAENVDVDVSVGADDSSPVLSSFDDVVWAVKDLVARKVQELQGEMKKRAEAKAKEQRIIAEFLLNNNNDDDGDDADSDDGEAEHELEEGHRVNKGRGSKCVSSQSPEASTSSPLPLSPLPLCSLLYSPHHPQGLSITITNVEQMLMIVEGDGEEEEVENKSLDKLRSSSGQKGDGDGGSGQESATSLALPLNFSMGRKVVALLVALQRSDRCYQSVSALIRDLHLLFVKSIKWRQEIHGYLTGTNGVRDDNDAKDADDAQAVQDGLIPPSLSSALLQSGHSHIIDQLFYQCIIYTCIDEDTFTRPTQTATGGAGTSEDGSDGGGRSGLVRTMEKTMQRTMKREEASVDTDTEEKEENVVLSAFKSLVQARLSSCPSFSSSPSFTSLSDLLLQTQRLLYRQHKTREIEREENVCVDILRQWFLCDDGREDEEEERERQTEKREVILRLIRKMRLKETEKRKKERQEKRKKTRGKKALMGQNTKQGEGVDEDESLVAHDCFGDYVSHPLGIGMSLKQQQDQCLLSQSSSAPSPSFFAFSPNVGCSLFETQAAKEGRKTRGLQQLGVKIGYAGRKRRKLKERRKVDKEENKRKTKLMRRHNSPNRLTTDTSMKGPFKGGDGCSAGDRNGRVGSEACAPYPNYNEQRLLHPHPRYLQLNPVHAGSIVAMSLHRREVAHMQLQLSSPPPLPVIFSPYDYNMNVKASRTGDTGDGNDESNDVRFPYYSRSNIYSVRTSAYQPGDRRDVLEEISDLEGRLAGRERDRESANQKACVSDDDTREYVSDCDTAAIRAGIHCTDQKQCGVKPKTLKGAGSCSVASTILSTPDARFKALLALYHPTTLAAAPAPASVAASALESTATSPIGNLPQPPSFYLQQLMLRCASLAASGVTFASLQELEQVLQPENPPALEPCPVTSLVLSSCVSAAIAAEGTAGAESGKDHVESQNGSFPASASSPPPAAPSVSTDYMMMFLSQQSELHTVYENQSLVATVEVAREYMGRRVDVCDDDTEGGCGNETGNSDEDEEDCEEDKSRGYYSD